MDKKMVVDHRNRINQHIQHLNQEIQELAKQHDTKQQHADLLKQQLTILQELDTNAHYKTQFEDMQNRYEKERERLEKLFRKYATTESELEKLREEIKQWHDWYDYNKQIFDRLFNTPPLNGTTTPAPKKSNDLKKSLTKRKIPQPPK